MRKATLKRNTAETQIDLVLNLDGSGTCDIATKCGFFDHMMCLFAKHGRFDMTLCCNGDTQVDYHHSVEDIGIVLGRAFSEALGDRVGILRYGTFFLPMDEALVMVSLDICGRSTLVYDVPFETEKIGDFDTELVKEFFQAFARELGAAIHVKKMAGENSHHVAEAAFKGLARALRQAVSIDPQAPNEIPSTKGTIL